MYVCMYVCMYACMVVCVCVCVCVCASLSVCLSASLSVCLCAYTHQWQERNAFMRAMQRPTSQTPIPTPQSLIPNP